MRHCLLMSPHFYIFIKVQTSKKLKLNYYLPENMRHIRYINNRSHRNMVELSKLQPTKFAASYNLLLTLHCQHKPTKQPEVNEEVA